MKIIQTEISPLIQSHLSLIERDESFFNSQYHVHPELELVYITESFGKRIIGDDIRPFSAGDMVLIGSDLPHIWLNDDIFYQNMPELNAKALVLYFNKNIFSSLFFEMKETEKLCDLFSKASRGASVTGKTREEVASKLQALRTKAGFDKIMGMFDILHILSESEELQLITSDAYQPELHFAQNDRLSEIYRYIRQNFKENISLATMADISNLTPQSFCRFFKKRTGKNFIEYLNEVRIAAARRSLLETDSTIAEIAYACGFKTVSNFNRLFKDTTGKSPREFRSHRIFARSG